MRHSLRGRLAVIYGVVFLGSMALVEGGLYLGARAAIDSVVNRELNARQVGVVEYLDKHMGRVAWPQIRESLLHDHEALQPKLLEISDEHGEVLFGSTALRSVAGTYEGTARLSDQRVDGALLRVRSVRLPIQGRPYRIRMASNLGFPLAMLGRLWIVMLLSSPVALGIATAAGYWISGRALAPVAEIADLAQSISASQSVRLRDLGRRVPVPERSDELQHLARTINDMLAKIEDSFRQATRFTADVSHELRTPLSVIRASAEIALLRVHPTEASYREALQRVLRESEKHSSLLEAMLRLSRFEAGVEQARAQRLDLRGSVLRAGDRFSPLAMEKGLTLSIKADGDAKWIVADEEHLRWLWAILLDNAIKYTATGGRVEFSVVEIDGRCVCTVADNGIGMAASDLSRIFQRFYRADTSRSRSTGGAGLGLSIARQIVAVYGASIHVESTPGAGSTFRVSFPPAPVGKAVSDDAPIGIPSSGNSQVPFVKT